MGVDLRLLPADHQGTDCNLSFDIIEMDRDSDLFELIGDLENEKGVEVKRGGIKSFSGRDERGKYDGECYGKTETHPYGDRIKSLLASELIKVLSNYNLSDNWKNRAVLSFLKECPKNLPIYLYWH